MHSSGKAKTVDDSSEMCKWDRPQINYSACVHLDIIQCNQGKTKKRIKVYGGDEQAVSNFGTS